MRFLGIDVEDALALAENTEIWPVGSSPPARGRFTALGTLLPSRPARRTSASG